MKEYTESNYSLEIALEELRQKLQANSEYNQAKQEGIEEGIQKGIEEGLEQGLEQKTKEIVLNMYNKGLSKEDIAKYTNVDINFLSDIIK